MRRRRPTGSRPSNRRRPSMGASVRTATRLADGAPVVAGFTAGGRARATTPRARTAREAAQARGSRARTGRGRPRPGPVDDDAQLAGRRALREHDLDLRHRVARGRLDFVLNCGLVPLRSLGAKKEAGSHPPRRPALTSRSGSKSSSGSRMVRNSGAVRALVQRVSEASVEVAGEAVSAIGRGAPRARRRRRRRHAPRRSVDGGQGRPASGARRRRGPDEPLGPRHGRRGARRVAVHALRRRVARQPARVYGSRPARRGRGARRRVRGRAARAGRAGRAGRSSARTCGSRS